MRPFPGTDKRAGPRWRSRPSQFPRPDAPRSLRRRQDHRHRSPPWPHDSRCKHHPGFPHPLTHQQFPTCSSGRMHYQWVPKADRPSEAGVPAAKIPWHPWFARTRPSRAAQLIMVCALPPIILRLLYTTPGENHLPQQRGKMHCFPRPRRIGRHALFLWSSLRKEIAWRGRGQIAVPTA